MDKKLKIFAGKVIVESKLSKSAKLQLLNFIQNEATIPQVKVLLMDGEIVSLDAQGEEIVNARFALSEAGGRIAKLRKTYMSGVGGAGGISPLWALYRKIRSLNDNCTRRCGTFETNTTRRQHCMIKCKVEKFEARLSAAKKSKNTTEIEKSESSLMKAKAEYMKSKASFKSRGAEE